MKFTSHINFPWISTDNLPIPWENPPPARELAALLAGLGPQRGAVTPAPRGDVPLGDRG